MEAGAKSEPSEDQEDGFMQGLIRGELRGSLVFPYPGPLDFEPRRESSDSDETAVARCRSLRARVIAAALAGETEFVDDPACSGRVYRAVRLAALAYAQLSEGIGVVRVDSRFGGSSRAAALLARLAAAVYTLEASAFTAAGWLDRGLKMETAFLEPLADDVLAPAVLGAIGLHEPFGRLVLNEPRCGSSATAELTMAAPPPADSDGLLAMLKRRLIRAATPTTAPTSSPMLRPFAIALGRRATVLGRVIESLATPRILDERLAAATVSLTAFACVLARIDAASSAGAARPDEHAVAELALHEHAQRFDGLIRSRNPDAKAVDVGRALLRGFARP